MKDVTPELLKKIQNSFDKKVSSDKTVAAFLKKVQDGKASLEELSLYGRKLGDHLASALLECITKDALPDETLYFNIANRIIDTTMHNNYNLVNEAAAAVQKAIDEAAAIGLNAVKAPYPEERVMAVINGLSQKTAAWEVIRGRMDEPIRNISQSFVDDFVRTNANFRSKAGLQTYIVRTAMGKCCDWCKNLAGSYAYPEDVPDDVFRRHDDCRCTVVYKCEKGIQNVWTKRWLNEGERDKIEERKRFATNNLGVFRPSEYAAVIGKHVRINRKDVVDAARQGKRHAGAYNDAMTKSMKQLKKSVISHVEQVERHAEKIQYPKKYILDWESKSPQYQRGLLRKWEKDMKRNAEQAMVELAVFEERFKNE